MEDSARPEDIIRVLLVDDEEGFVDVVKKRMNRRGMDVTAVTSGGEAVAVLRKNDFDCAVVDLKMEDMDGIDVLKIFKKMVPEMPVLILTGHGSEKAARQGLTHGAYDYLTKPCELPELLEKIREAVAQTAR